MERVPPDVWKMYLPKYLNPQELSRLNATCRKFRVFNVFVDPTILLLTVFTMRAEEVTKIS